MLPKIPQSPGLKNVFSVYSGDRLGLMECLPACPHSPRALPLLAVSPAPIPLQIHRMRAGYRKEKGCTMAVILQGELNEQQDTILPFVPPLVYPPSSPKYKEKYLDTKSLIKDS